MAAGVRRTGGDGPHDIRHTAITGVLDATGSIDKGQRFARHSSPVTTQVYDHRNKTLDDHPSYALAAYFAEGRPGGMTAGPGSDHQRRASDEG